MRIEFQSKTKKNLTRHPAKLVVYHDSHGYPVHIIANETYFAPSEMGHKIIREKNPQDYISFNRTITGTWLQLHPIDFMFEPGLSEMPEHKHHTLSYFPEVLDAEKNRFIDTVVLDTQKVELHHSLALADLDPRESEYMLKILNQDSRDARTHFQELHDILGGPIPVMQPELLYEHYHAAPVVVMEGCQHDCTDCAFYERGTYRKLGLDEIKEQIDLSAAFYGEEVDHINRISLLHSDAFVQDADTLEQVLVYARERFTIKNDMNSDMKKSGFAYAFAHPKSILKIDFTDLERLAPYLLGVNLGAESGDQELVNSIEKNLDITEVIEACEKLLDAGILPSANIMLGLGGTIYQESHEQKSIELIKQLPKGTHIYSPRLRIIEGSRYESEQMREWGRLDNRQILQQAFNFKRAADIAGKEWSSYFIIPM
ncbi:MAG: radical SAM protein [archaeon]